MLLGQTVAISFAMNLFFVAILLTPISLPRKEPKSKNLGSMMDRFPASIRFVTGKFQAAFMAQPADYRPHPAVYLFLLVVYYACVFLLPFSTSTPTFKTLLLVSHLLLFRTAYVDRLVFGFWEHMPGSRTPATIYRFMSATSMLLHAKQTFVALLDNDPGAYTHRHSAVLEYLHLQSPGYHGSVERSTTAIGRVYGSLNSHPAVSSVGWDVLLCGLSLIVWATVRGLDLRRIASNAGLLRTVATDHKEDQIADDEPSKPVTRSSTSGKSKKSSNTSTRRRRGTAAESDDSTYSDVDAHGSSEKAVEGEEEMLEDPEAGALSWALFALGGLGAVAAGVLGGEVDTV